MANPNPSPETRFGAENGNPSNGGGKTKEQKRLEMESSFISAQLRHSALSIMLEKVRRGEVEADALITSDNLRLFKDSEDRAHGKAEETVNSKYSLEGANKLQAFLDGISERSGTDSGASEE